MKDRHKKRHETLHYKEREETGTGWKVMFPVVLSLCPPLIIIMDFRPLQTPLTAQSIKALRGKSERNAEVMLCCGVRTSDDGSDLLSFSSSAILSHNYQIRIDFHNLATITQYFAIFRFNGNHSGRDSRCLAVVTFSLLVTKIYRAGPGNKTRQKCLSFLPHPLLSNLSLSLHYYH